MSVEEWILIVLITLLIVCVLGLIYCILMLKRNDEVCEFRKSIIKLVYRNKDYKQLEALYKRYSYDDMLNKFWIPLRLDKWYTEAEVKLLEGTI